MTGAHAAEPLLAMDAVTVSLGATILVNGVSLQLDGGEILGLVGASGSGKTLTALAVMRLLAPPLQLTGSVRLSGESLSGKSDRELQRIRGQSLSMVFQEPKTALNPLMGIGRQIEETVRLHRAVSRAESRRMAQAALDEVGLRGAAADFGRLPHELSGGQRQRVAIAAAVVLAPAVLIADEPTASLDGRSQAEVLGLLESLARSRNMGLILITHDLALVARLTDRVAVMHQGELVEQGATRELLRHPRHPSTRALTQAAGMQTLRTPARAASRPSAANPSAAPPLLQVRGVVRDYRPRGSVPGRREPNRAVDAVSLHVDAGETVGLVGESGSGKSTLLRVILALDEPQSGEVRLLGQRLTHERGAALRRLRRCVQAVFQDPYGSFDPRWSVERLIAEPLQLLDAAPTGRERTRRVAAALEQVGLAASDSPRHAHEFSGGQRQRIAIARALIIEPKLIVFDEAVSALDAVVRTQILRLLTELAARLQLAYLFVSHDLHVVRAIADRIYVMQAGRIVEAGSTSVIFAAPRHAHTRELLAAAHPPG